MDGVGMIKIDQTMDGAGCCGDDGAVGEVTSRSDEEQTNKEREIQVPRRVVRGGERAGERGSACCQAVALIVAVAPDSKQTRVLLTDAVATRGARGEPEDRREASIALGDVEVVGDGDETERRKKISKQQKHQQQHHHHPSAPRARATPGTSTSLRPSLRSGLRLEIASSLAARLQPIRSLDPQGFQASRSGPPLQIAAATATPGLSWTPPGPQRPNLSVFQRLYAPVSAAEAPARENEAPIGLLDPVEGEQGSPGQTKQGRIDRPRMKMLFYPVPCIDETLAPSMDDTRPLALARPGTTRDSLQGRPGLLGCISGDSSSGISVARPSGDEAYETVRCASDSIQDHYLLHQFPLLRPRRYEYIRTNTMHIQWTMHARTRADHACPPRMSAVQYAVRWMTYAVLACCCSLCFRTLQPGARERARPQAT
ncbi:hypothetical protein G7046_g7777 [Stylonectria norvegica]|nr:hypothetical protein G7046_g7777 [Stylonectria norvegica]